MTSRERTEKSSPLITREKRIAFLFKIIDKVKTMARIGDTLSNFTGIFKRQDSPPPSKTLSINNPSHASTSSTGARAFDQKAIDKEIEYFTSKGQPSGHRTSADSPPEDLSPDVIEYRAKHQKALQARKDIGMRDTLFDQPVSGRVNGNEVEPFSSSKLKENSEALVKADAAAPAPFHFKNTLKTAATTALLANLPATITAFIIINTANQPINQWLNPAAPAVQLSMDDVFKVFNTWNELHGQPTMYPSQKWSAQTDDERLDTLEDMVSHAEKEIGDAAKKLGIPFQLASTGALQDDINSRTTGIQSRLAVLSSLFKEMQNKLKTQAG